MFPMGGRWGGGGQGGVVSFRFIVGGGRENIWCFKNTVKSSANQESAQDSLSLEVSPGAFSRGVSRCVSARCLQVRFRG